jgi:hypothetical protein
VSKIRYQVQVIYDAEFYPDADTLIEAKVGRKCDAAGMGFGERDIVFDFTRAVYAVEAFTALASIRQPETKFGHAFRLSLEKVSDE